MGFVKKLALFVMIHYQLAGLTSIGICLFQVFRLLHGSKPVSASKVPYCIEALSLTSPSDSSMGK